MSGRSEPDDLIDAIRRIRQVVNETQDLIVRTRGEIVALMKELRPKPVMNAIRLRRPMYALPRRFRLVKRIDEKESE